MIKSMTGFGRGSEKSGSGQINVEIKSLNSRYLDLKFSGFSLPQEIEDNFRNIISGALIRGNIKVFVEIDSPKNDQLITLNEQRLEKIMHIIDYIDKKYDKKLDLSQIINFNDMLTFADTEFLEYEKLNNVVRKAILQLNEMRALEGKQLYKDLYKRVITMKKDLKKIEKLSAKNSKSRMEDLKEKIISLTNNDMIDQNRLIQEIAYLVERSDITEEIVRTNIHIDNFIKYLKYNEPVGKRLNFLIQEINREVNTIGSKSPVSDVTTMIVEIKNEIEKIREQIQNIL